MESLRGHLLIASRKLLDPNFNRTVVLLIQHSDEGALGVVVNRPTSKTVEDLWREVGDSPCRSPEAVHLGGPVSGPIMCIHTDPGLGEAEIVPGVFFAATKENLDQLVSQQEHPFKIFVGHAGWGAGQLESELAEGAWLTAAADSEYVFYDGEDLWQQVTRRKEELTLPKMLHIKHVPEDPSMN